MGNVQILAADDDTQRRVLGKDVECSTVVGRSTGNKFRKLTAHFNHRAEEVLLVGSCFAERAEMYRQRHLADESIDFQKLEHDLDSIFQEPQWHKQKKAVVAKKNPLPESLDEQGEEKVQP